MDSMFISEAYDEMEWQLAAAARAETTGDRPAAQWHLRCALEAEQAMQRTKAAEGAAEAAKELWS